MCSGTSPEPTWQNPFFGFTEVRVYSTGRVGVVSHARDVPSPYSAPQVKPAAAAKEITIFGG